GFENPWLGHGHTDEGKGASENSDRQQKVGDWTGCHDSGALPHRLTVKVAGVALGIRRRGGFAQACRISIAQEFHVAAQGNPAHPPTCSMAVVPAGDLAAKADGEGFNSHATPARHQEMAEFVNETDN